MYSYNVSWLQITENPVPTDFPVKRIYHLRSRKYGSRGCSSGGWVRDSVTSGEPRAILLECLLILWASGLSASPLLLLARWYSNPSIFQMQPQPGESRFCSLRDQQGKLSPEAPPNTHFSKMSPQFFLVSNAWYAQDIPVTSRERRGLSSLEYLWSALRDRD